MLVRFEVLCTETVLCLGAAIFLRNGWWSLFSLKVCSSVDLVFVLIESSSSIAHVPNLWFPSP